MINTSDTIAAIATPSGRGGIAVIRISGPAAMETVGKAWKGADLLKVSSHTAHLGQYISTEGNLMDQCVATVYRNPRSFTGEDVVELAIHGSEWIQREILTDLIRRGVRIAAPGEFTQRAFMNGKMDLSQAEGVADIIAASSKAGHELALRQTGGTFSKGLEILRQELIDFASLIELELDFSEEEVEFAERERLLSLCKAVKGKVDKLASSYSSGSVLKAGIPVAIAGIPNAGKSSLLNLLLGTDKAIVTDIPGTTRDIIEDSTEIDGILYRFIDTAGLRSTDDFVEEKGIERARAAIEKAFIVIWMIDPTVADDNQWKELNDFIEGDADAKLVVLLNKSDLDRKVSIPPAGMKYLDFSTVTGAGLKELKDILKAHATSGIDLEKDLIVTNARHYEALLNASESLQGVEEGIEQNLSGDFIAQDIRESIHHLSLITGQITTDNLLQTIFSRFCIGK